MSKIRLYRKGTLAPLFFICGKMEHDDFCVLLVAGDDAESTADALDPGAFSWPEEWDGYDSFRMIPRGWALKADVVSTEYTVWDNHRGFAAFLKAARKDLKSPAVIVSPMRKPKAVAQ
jgi:hypothetical protein